MEVSHSELKALVNQLESQSRENYIPIIDREDAAVLSSLAFLAKPGLFIDLGAGVGYSTLWLAIGAMGKHTTKIIAVEWDEDLADFLKRNAHAIERVTNVKVEVVVADAIEYLNNLEGDVKFSLAFVDIEKHQYPKAFDLLVGHMIHGGIMAFHNAYYPAPPKEFFKKIERFKNIIIPTPQGLAIVSI